MVEPQLVSLLPSGKGFVMGVRDGGTALRAYVEVDAETGVRYAGDRELVDCDATCDAYEQPVTLAEFRASLEHYRSHHVSGGCSHGG